MKPAMYWTALALPFLLLVAGCEDEEQNQTCERGSTRSCSCANGRTGGSQICLVGGGYSTCTGCGTADTGGGGGDASADTSADTGGGDTGGGDAQADIPGEDLAGEDLPAEVGDESGYCDFTGCGVCRADNCFTIDNPCNDDPTGACEPAQQAYRSCVCATAGDEDASAACDDDFLAAADEELAQPIIDCLRDNCDECFVPGEDTGDAECPVLGGHCLLCTQVECGEGGVPCLTNQTCGAAAAVARECICDAQQGDGTIEACVGEANSTGGELIAPLLSCVATNCGDLCITGE